jgi:hypothetical protein
MEIICVGKAEGSTSFASMLQDNGDAFPSLADRKSIIDPKSHVTLLPYSSGTTGMPKVKMGNAKGKQGWGMLKVKMGNAQGKQGWGVLKGKMGNAQSQRKQQARTENSKGKDGECPREARMGNAQGKNGECPREAKMGNDQGKQGWGILKGNKDGEC